MDREEVKEMYKQLLEEYSLFELWDLLIDAYQELEKEMRLNETETI